jgi:hypothetical protein
MHGKKPAILYSSDQIVQIWGVGKQMIQKSIMIYVKLTMLGEHKL